MTASLVERVYQEESRRVFATLVRLLGGDFDLAEEAMQEAFTIAVERWHKEGVPKNPRSWLISTGRFKAIDVLRRRGRFDAALEKLARELPEWEEPQEGPEVEDDRLRLIFTCCHPAIAPPIQVALTLREVCGLRTDEIASAFLVSPTTMAQRIVRGKAKIRGAGIPYQVPSREDLPERLDTVLSVIYLVYNAGYSDLEQPELSQEAIRLARLVQQLLPDPEVQGLLALMLLQESRRRARTNQQGEIILLEDQDRSLWDAQLIAEGQKLVAQAFTAPIIGSYTLQAAIAAEHAGPAPTAWNRVVALYDLLLQAQPSPVIQLNRAVALSMRDGPQAALEQVEQLIQQGDLAEYHLAHAVHADLCRRLGHNREAADSYRAALQRVRHDQERKFLQKRLAEVSNPDSPERPQSGGARA